MKTTAEKIAVMQAYIDGKPIEVRIFAEWKVTGEPSWNWDLFDYRVAVTKPSINPDHVADRYKWMATDNSGSSWLYKTKPIMGGNCWRTNDALVEVDHFASFVPGTCDWKDSLVRIR